MLDALAWYLTLQVVALAAWPLTARALAPLDDRGWGVSKIGAAVLVAWAAWFVCMLAPLPYAWPLLWLLVLGIAAAAWLGLGVARSDLLAWMRGRVPLLVAWEVVLLVAFALFALLRAYDPSIQSTEKPMDMAFLNGFITATRLPTEDTWLAGYGVPYYYFGYFTFATLAKLAGTPAAVAYNLAAASVPALAAVALASLAWNLASAASMARWQAAVSATLAPVLVLLVGNLSAPLELLVSRGVLGPDAGRVLSIKSFAEGVVPGVWPPAGAWWWHASRVVPNIQPDGIDEFPFFSAFLSDLHPHFMALPLEVLALAALAAHVLTRGASLRSPWTQGASALALGALMTGNTWDLAAFWLLYLALAWAATRCLDTRRRLMLVAAGPVLAVVLFAPYFVGYGGPPLSPGIVTERTPIGSELVLFGPQIGVLAAFGVWQRRRVGERRGWLLALAALAAGVLLAAAGEPTLGLLVALLGLLLPWPSPLDRVPPGLALVAAFAAWAAAILLGVELVFVRDSFGTRMNTVFKLHYNAWLFAGLAVAVGIGLLLGARGWVRWTAGGLAALAIAAGLVYPVSAIETRLAAPPAYGRTLDGAAYLSTDERAAVEWLRQQAQTRRPVIAEAVLSEYSQGARMATFSGGVSVLGWPGHELQWRGPLPVLGQREDDVKRLYTGDPAAIDDVLQRYGVRYVVVGDLERSYGPGVDARFHGRLPVAFRSGRVTIYRVGT